MQTVTLARNAMATRFEIVLHGQNAVALRAAGEAVLDEIARVEAQLNLYRSTSEIAHVNERAAHEPVRVTPGLFALLQHVQTLSEETGGAFDITVAPLVRCWGFMEGEGRIPRPEALAEARRKVGMNLVRLNEADSTVRFAREGVMLDLGAIGKGYAVDCAVAVLREAGVASALVHGGTSTIYGLGHPPDADFWQVAVVQPPAGVRSSAFAWPVVAQLPAAAALARSSAPWEGGTPNLLAAIPLKDESLSVSAVWGKSFQAEGKRFGHVLDPRSGQTVSGALLAAVVLPSATETDALSTALLALGKAGFEAISRLRPEIRTLLVTLDGDELRVESRGIDV